MYYMYFIELLKVDYQSIESVYNEEEMEQIKNGMEKVEQRTEK